ncbi:helix-turn-helix transcriptional regulator [Paenibacillus guangzhouensis]|uniref:hypothetical protein n=1 Tax=Paenibacillus guangzhouensis TaxID=1473112 RepID=UPI0012670C46|nr:hypothetical protein [Paenibacillus guangzhouensis]
MGTSIQEHGSNVIQRFRVWFERANFLVLITDKKIYEIATEIGFRKLDTFYKRFKTYTGKSAGEIRAESGMT